MWILELRASLVGGLDRLMSCEQRSVRCVRACVCASRYGLAVWDWYALVTRLPGVVVGSQGGGGQGGCDGEQRRSRHGSTHAGGSGTRGYMNSLGDRKGQNWDNE